MGRPKRPPTTKLVRLKTADALKLEAIAESLGGVPIHDAFRRWLGKSLDRVHKQVSSSAKAGA